MYVRGYAIVNGLFQFNKKMSDSSSGGDENTPKKYRKQRFCSSWLRDEKLLGWLEPVKDDEFKCRCKACGKILNCAREEKENLIRKLQIYKFSVLLDESTDVSSQKTMCLLVRHYDEEQEKTFVQLLELIHVGADCTTEALYGLFKKCILSFNIPFDNIIGLCCDGANVMVGQNNSFASRLLKDNPDVITIKCICHTAAIIANKSCLMLPRAPEDLVRQIGTYISGSSKRCSQLEKFQEMMNEEKKIIKNINNQVAVSSKMH
ncbi:E3 SUMO-protein ligase [Lucilia cuprina]|nr:E3 SUMO-protein ligase [Lucilia cuprina]